MSSTFSSTKAEYNSTNSRNTPHSRSRTVSERSTSASTHSKTSKPSSRASSGTLSASISNPSEGSFSKSNCRKSSTHSTNPLLKQESMFKLVDIRTNGQNIREFQQLTPAIESYVACPLRSNIHNASTIATTATTMTETEYRARMQAILYDLGPHLDLDDTSTNISDTPVNIYDTELDLDGCDSEEYRVQ